MFTLPARVRSIPLSVALCLSLVRPAHTAISTTGNVTPDPSTATSSNDLYVGNTADGTMNIDASSDVASRIGYVGNASGITGIATVDGVGSTWTNSSSLFVGYSGDGTLEIANGGQVSSNGNSAYVGYGNNSKGKVTVDGAGSTWTNNNVLYVGYSGLGVFEITSGGQANSNSNWVYIGRGEPGRATVDGSGSTWTTSGDFWLGYFDEGVLEIKGGGLVSNRTGYLGTGSTTSSGVVTVDGIGSTWMNSADVLVGRHGEGTLTITDGGHVFSTAGYIGRNTNSTGTTTVDGLGSTWTNSSVVYAGYAGDGTLNITGGGHVSSTGAGYVAYEADSTGTVRVDGPGSAWTNNFRLVVGNYGDAELHITGGGQVTNSDGFLAYNAGSTGVATVSGSGSIWTTNFSLFVGRNGTGRLDVAGGGTVDAAINVRIGDGVSGIGTINLFDGILRLHGGALSKGSGTAAFNFAGGRLEGAGTINLGGAFVQNGGTLAPGNSAGSTTIQGDFTLDAGAIEIEIDSFGGAGVGWDVVNVNGAVDLLGNNGLADGGLNVVLGFAPTVGQEFLILDNDGADSITGTFAGGSTLKAPYNGSLYEFAIDYTCGTGNDVGLSTQTVGLLGDYNGDGSVDATDYLVWRKTLYTTVSRYFGADGSGNGVIDEDDYLLWQSNFGRTAAGGTGSSDSAESATVPEPTTVVLVSALFVVSVFLRRGPWFISFLNMDGMP